MQPATPRQPPQARPIDLDEAAQLRPGERVEVRRLGTTDEEPFEQTVALLSLPQDAQEEARRAALVGQPADYLPDDAQLRTVYLFAEAVGGYQQLHDLVYAYSPGLNLIEQVRATVAREPLRPLQLRDLTSYHDDIVNALRAAHVYLQTQGTGPFSEDDVRQLYILLTEARRRAEVIERILGQNLAHEVQAAVHRLHELRETMRGVEESVSGILLVESKVLFLPTEELMQLIATIFRGVGNRYLADHVSGVTLLAARNLLIQVVAFYSYYGRQQIHSMLKRSGASANTRGVALYIRGEIRRVFEACQRENRLILRRIMREAEEEFELSVEAIQHEAEASALTAVRQLLPAAAPAPRAPRPWWQRLWRWLR